MSSRQSSTHDSHIFGFQIYVVSGNSMMPNFRVADRLLVRARGPRSRPPSRGDVVVIGYENEPERRSVKRVVALPGESVQLSEGSLFIDGRHVREPYLRGLPANLGLEELSWTLAENDYFVMGDNRAHSVDSRQFGPIRAGSIPGTVMLRIWPLWRKRSKRAYPA